MKLIHDNATPEALDVLRIYVFGFWFFIILGDPFYHLAHLPQSVFVPTGIFLRFLPEAMHPLILNIMMLYFLKFLLLLFVMGTLFKRNLIFSMICASFFLTIHQELDRSFGYSNHAEIILLYAVYVLTACTVCDKLIRKKEKNFLSDQINLNSIPFIFLLIIMTIPYVYVGIHRLVYGGVELFMSDTMVYRIVEESYVQHHFEWNLHTLVLKYPEIGLILKIGYPMVTIVEVLAPFIFVSNGFRYVFLAVMIPFHLMVWLFMDIIFWEYMALYVLYFDFTPLFAPRKIQGSHPIIFFDGVCGLCNSFADDIMKRDRIGVFRLAPIQGETAQAYVSSMPKDPKEWSIVLVDEGKNYYRSDAVLRIYRGLGGIWRLMGIFAIVPRFIRDGVYEYVAKRRYAVFGKRESCRVPTQEEKDRMYH